MTAEFPEPVLSIASLCMPQKALESISEHAFLLFSKTPEPPRRLLFHISECTLHTAGESTYT